MNISSYRTIVFDCDGVILNSNPVKTEAFRKAALPYGKEAANQLVSYHQENGGISRFKKFEWFLSQLDNQSIDQDAMKDLLHTFAKHVREGMASCAIDPAIELLREQTPDACWMVVSGGEEAELRSLFEDRSLSWMFDGGIYGSPRTKEDIVTSELNSGNLQHPAVFLGDSKYDYSASQECGLDFVFIRGWSEVSDVDRFLSEKRLPSVESLSELLNTPCPPNSAFSLKS